MLQKRIQRHESLFVLLSYETIHSSFTGSFSADFRLEERRRSSVVVSLPGLDVSPGDLFVSNGAADILNNFSGMYIKKKKNNNSYLYCTLSHHLARIPKIAFTYMLPHNMSVHISLVLICQLKSSLNLPRCRLEHFVQQRCVRLKVSPDVFE